MFIYVLDIRRYEIVIYINDEYFSFQTFVKVQLTLCNIPNHM